MSEQRVLATPVALQAARQMRATVNQLRSQAQQIIAKGQVLTRPAAWDGVDAARFRQETWPGVSQSMTRIMQHLDQLDAHAEKVLEDIMRAGTASSVTPARPPPPAPPAPKPETHHGGVMGWVHAGLAVASFIPVVGTAASLVDAGIYVAQGDYVGAGLSAAGAIPIGGEAANVVKAARLAEKGAKALEETSQAAKAVEATGGGARAVEAGDKAVQGERALGGAAKPIPDAKRLGPYEQETAGRLQQHFPDRTFRESDHVGAEYVDDLGKSYDALGTPKASEFWNEKEFLNAIDTHLRKSNDFTVVDLTGFKPEQVTAVRNYLDAMPPAAQAKFIRIGL